MWLSNQQCLQMAVERGWLVGTCVDDAQVTDVGKEIVRQEMQRPMRHILLAAFPDQESREIGILLRVAERENGN